MRITVETYPVKGHVRLYGATPGYNMMAEGRAPQSADRPTPWGYVVRLDPTVENGVTWAPVFGEQRGVCEKDETLRFRYVKV